MLVGLTKATERMGMFRIRANFRIVAVTAAMATWSHSATAESDPAQLAHVVRVAAEFEIERDRISYDEYVECRLVQTRRTNTI